MIENSRRMLKTPKAIIIDDHHYILTEDYTYSWQMAAYENVSDKNKKDIVTTFIKVKAGFRWDGASVPNFFRYFGFERDGEHRAAALIHDFIYIHRGKLPDGSITADYHGVVDQHQHGSFSRKDADRLFGQMMKKAGLPSCKRQLMKWAVILFGWLYWPDGPDMMLQLIAKSLIYLSVITLLGLILYRIS